MSGRVTNIFEKRLCRCVYGIGVYIVVRFYILYRLAIHLHLVLYLLIYVQPIHYNYIIYIKLPQNKC